MSFTETDIHRLIDGELTPEDAAKVSAWVESDATRKAQADAYRLQAALLHVRFDAMLNEPVPPRLLAAAQVKPAANDSRFLRVAGQALFAAVCIGAGWMGHVWLGSNSAAGPDMSARLPLRAAVAHAVYAPEVRHPVEVGADQETHLVQWLSKRLAVPVRAPGLSRHGFRLVGGRLLPGEDRPVAQFMYQNEAGKRLTLYVLSVPNVRTAAARQATESSFRFEKVGDVNVFHWTDDTRGYALSGDLSREDLLPIARTVYDDLETKDSKGG
jgi:anti-sigma factor RsiW